MSGDVTEESAEREGDDTCAGKPIRSAMHPFSADLMAGCERLASLAQGAEDIEAIRCHNTACVMFAVSTIEAKVNEWISIASRFELGPLPDTFWAEVLQLQRTLRLDRKWNLIASLHGGSLWNSAQEPFQSYEVITALRNELVHYKGQFLGKDETPNKKIEGLMKQLGVKSEASFIEHDVSSWSHDLLASRALGKWIVSKIRPFYEDVLSMLQGRP